MSDVLNQWAQGVKPSDGFQKHPVGDFSGVIASIKHKIITKTGTPVWNVVVRTDHGSGTYTLWGFNQGDLHKAQTTQEGRDKVLGAMGRYKRLYMDLGVWSEDQALSAGWDQGPYSILGSLNQLLGKACVLHVEVSNTDPNKQMIYINAPAQLDPAKSGVQEDIAPPQNNQTSQVGGHQSAPPFPDDTYASQTQVPPGQNINPPGY